MKERDGSENHVESDIPDCLIACPDFLLSTLALSVTELIEESLAPLDLRLRHYRLLRLLYFEGAQPQGDLARALRADRTTIVSIVDHLERKQLAKRTRNVTDRRAYTVSLTASGRKIAQRAIASTTDLERRMFAPLIEREQQTLRRLSTRLLAEPGPIASAQGRALDDY